MKALGIVVSDKKIFENCILKTYFLTPWPTFATNQNHLNNFGRVHPRDHSCEVWSKSNEWFQRRRCLSKNVYARRTPHDPRRTMTDDGQRPVTIAHPEHFVLRWAKNPTHLRRGVLMFVIIKNLFDWNKTQYLKKISISSVYKISIYSDVIAIFALNWLNDPQKFQMTLNEVRGSKWPPVVPQLSMARENPAKCIWLGWFQVTVATGSMYQLWTVGHHVPRPSCQPPCSPANQAGPGNRNKVIVELFIYWITSVEQHQAATYILVALERCCSSEVIFNGQCAGEIFLPDERGSCSLELPL